MSNFRVKPLEPTAENRKAAKKLQQVLEQYFITKPQPLITQEMINAYHKERRLYLYDK